MTFILYIQYSSIQILIPHCINNKVLKKQITLILEILILHWSKFGQNQWEAFPDLLDQPGRIQQQNLKNKCSHMLNMIYDLD